MPASIVGALAVELGLDTAKFEQSLKNIPGIAGQHLNAMSSEMKRTSREGAESLRLIDEAIGLHLSRPITKIVTEQFPGLAKGLQEIMGVGLVGAIAVTGIEFVSTAIEKLSAAIDKARKAEEELIQSSEHLHSVLENISDKALLPSDQLSAISLARQRMDDITEAELRNIKATEEANSSWHKFLLTLGDFFHQISTSQSNLDFEQSTKGLTELKAKLDEVVRADILQGKKNPGLGFLNEQIASINGQLALAQREAEDAKKEMDNLAGVGHGVAAQVAAATAPTEGRIKGLEETLKALHALRDAALLPMPTTHVDKLKQSAEESSKAVEKFAERLEKLHASLLPPKDALAQLDDELKKNELSFRSLYETMGDQAWFVKFHESYSQVIQDLRNANLQKETAIKLDELMKNGVPGAAPQKFPQLPGTPVPLPVLGEGGKSASDFDKFAADFAAQMEKAAQAYEDVITPAEKYKLAQQELNLLLEKGLIDQAAYTAAIQKAATEFGREQDKFIIEWDDAAFRFGSFGDKVKGVMNEIALAGEHAGERMALAWVKAVDDVNGEFAKLLTGQKTDFKHVVISLAQEQTKGELEKAEAWIAKQFGIKIPGLEGKPDGTKDRPLYVTATDSSILSKDKADGPLSGLKSLFGGKSGDDDASVVEQAKAQGADGGVGSIFGLFLGFLKGGASGISGSPSAKGMPGNSTMVTVAGVVPVMVMNQVSIAGLPTMGAGMPGSKSPVALGMSTAIEGLGSRIGGLVSFFGGFRAEGGPVMPGADYIIGEKGPELLRIPHAGTIISNADMRSMGTYHRGGDVRNGPVVNQTFNGVKDTDSFRRTTRQELARMLRHLR